MNGQINSCTSQASHDSFGPLTFLRSQPSPFGVCKARAAGPTKYQQRSRQHPRCLDNPPKPIHLKGPCCDVIHICLTRSVVGSKQLLVVHLLLCVLFFVLFLPFFLQLLVSVQALLMLLLLLLFLFLLPLRMFLLLPLFLSPSTGFILHPTAPIEQPRVQTAEYDCSSAQLVTSVFVETLQEGAARVVQEKNPSSSVEDSFAVWNPAQDGSGCATNDNDENVGNGVRQPRQEATSVAGPHRPLLSGTTDQFQTIEVARVEVRRRR